MQHAVLPTATQQTPLLHNHLHQTRCILPPHFPSPHAHYDGSHGPHPISSHPRRMGSGPSGMEDLEANDPFRKPHQFVYSDKIVLESPPKLSRDYLLSTSLCCGSYIVTFMVMFIFGSLLFALGLSGTGVNSIRA